MIIVLKRGQLLQKWTLDESGRIIECLPRDEFYTSCTVNKAEYLRKGIKPLIKHDQAEKAVEHPVRVLRVIPTVKIKVITNKASLMINGRETHSMILEDVMRQILVNRYVLSNPQALPAFFLNQYNQFPHTQI
jgi:hypothetical protein